MDADGSEVETTGDNEGVMDQYDGDMASPGSGRRAAPMRKCQGKRVSMPRLRKSPMEATILATVGDVRVKEKHESPSSVVLKWW